MPGWLGPWEPEDLSRSLTYAPFPCHRTIKGDDVEEMQACAGAAIHLNNRVEQSKCPANAVMQGVMREVCAETPGLADTVFKWQQDFIAHHTQDAGEWYRRKEAEKVD